jgi:hypothetical protein
MQEISISKTKYIVLITVMKAKLSAEAKEILPALFYRYNLAKFIIYNPITLALRPATEIYHYLKKKKDHAYNYNINLL